MGEYPVTSKAILVGPHLVNIVLDLRRYYFTYLDVSGTSYKVLGVLGTSYLRVSRRTTTPIGDLDRAIEVLAYDLHDGKKFCVYRVEPAPTLAGELTTAEVS